LAFPWLSTLEFLPKKSLALSAATFGLCGVLSVWLGGFPGLTKVGLTRAVFLVFQKQVSVISDF